MKLLMKRLFSILVTMLLAAGYLSAQEYYDEPVYEPGEKAVYNLYFNWGFIWVHAGDCHFKVQNKKVNSTPAWALLVAGSTTSTFDKMYTIRDSFEAYVNPATQKPIYYKEDKHENSYESHLTYHYDYVSDGANVEMRKNRKGKLKEKQIKLDTKTYDLIASCYHFRNLNTDNLKQNQVVPFNMVFDDDIYNLGLTFKGKTTITLKNGDQYRALKFMPKLITGDLFQDEDDMCIYVTDDKNHIPLMIEAKIKVGSVKAMLSSVSKHKYPLTSYIGKKK